MADEKTFCFIFVNRKCFKLMKIFINFDIKISLYFDIKFLEFVMNSGKFGNIDVNTGQILISVNFRPNLAKKRGQKF